MGFLSKRKQNVTYWPSVKSDGFPVLGSVNVASSTIKARWQDLQEKFIDLEGREDVSRSVIYTLPELDKGGFVLLGTDVGPGFANEWPPIVPLSLIEYLEYWDFNDDLDGVNGNNLTLTSGSSGFGAGNASTSAVSSDGAGGFTLTSVSSLVTVGLTTLTMAFWVKSAATISNTSSATLLLSNNLLLTINAGSVNNIIWGDSSATNTSTLSLSANWALSKFASVIVTWSQGAIQDIYLGGIKQTVVTTAIHNSTLTSDTVLVTSAISDITKNILIDDARVYNTILSDKDINTLAAVHPSQYVNAYEIRQTAFSTNLRGTKKIYKSWLKSKE